MIVFKRISFFLCFICPLILFGMDYNNPSLEDLANLQQIYLDQAEKILPYFDTYDAHFNRTKNHRPSRYTHFRFYDESLTAVPNFQVVHFSPKNRRKECIVVYCGLNGPYKDCIPILIDTLKKQNYQGDLLYQVGGWPYLKEDSLKAFRTPYGFKPCACMEALDRDYHYALWLDTVLVPKININRIFAQIKNYDLFVYTNPIKFQNPTFRYTLLNYSSHLGHYFHKPAKDLLRIPHLNTAVIGFNFTKDKTRTLVKNWFKTAKDFTPFLFATMDQFPFSCLADELALNTFLIPHHSRSNWFKLLPQESIRE